MLPKTSNRIQVRTLRSPLCTLLNDSLPRQARRSRPSRSWTFSPGVKSDLCRLFQTAFTSRSRTNPQNGYSCVRRDKSFSKIFPHSLHICDVYMLDSQEAVDHKSLSLCKSVDAWIFPVPHRKMSKRDICFVHKPQVEVLNRNKWIGCCQFTDQLLPVILPLTGDFFVRSRYLLTAYLCLLFPCFLLATLWCAILKSHRDSSRILGNLP